MTLSGNGRKLGLRSVLTYEMQVCGKVGRDEFFALK